MLYPLSMTEVELIVPARDMVGVTRTLAGQMGFHQIDTSYLSTDNKLKPTESWPQRAATYTALERKITSAMRVLNIDRTPPPPVDQMNAIEIEDAQPVVDGIDAEIHAVTDRRAEEQKKLEQNQNFLAQLEPISDLDVDISSLRNSRYVFTTIGTIPCENMERLRMSLVRIPFAMLTLREGPHEAVVWVAGLQSQADILERALRSAYLNSLTMPESYKGTLVEVTAAIRREIDSSQARFRELDEQLLQLRKKYESQLQSLFWQVNAGRILADAIAHFGKLQHTYIIFGWVPAIRLPLLIERLKVVSKSIVIETFPVRRAGVASDVPVTLSNNRLLRPFQELVTTFAQPRYDEIDPTILMAITFPILFGAMFGDVGHGIELALVGLLLTSGRVKFLRALSGLGRLITICGVSAALFGFLYGSFFGLENVVPALWFHPINNILTILAFSVGAGIFLLTVGYLIGILNAWIARDWGRFFFDHNGLAGLVLYWSLLGIVASIAIKNFPIPTAILVLLAVVAGVAVMFSEIWKHMLENIHPLVEGGLGTYLIQVIFEMFETLIAYLSNSLSYMRVGAFAVAHAGLSSVFFILAELVSPGHGIGYWIVVVIGNIFIIGFEGLIVGIQTMRLEYYEFFSKFFRGGGLRSQPLSLRSSVEDYSG
jgi:V/A-type H+/Na+-transporting ATPase subunit I